MVKKKIMYMNNLRQVIEYVDNLNSKDETMFNVVFNCNDNENDKVKKNKIRSEGDQSDGC